MGDRLREWRRRKMLTQGELAKAIPVKYQTVQRWESGESIPWPQHQRRLCEVLDVSPDAMLAALDAVDAARKEQGTREG